MKRILRRFSNKPIHFIPAKIGSGRDYVSLLFFSTFLCISCVYLTTSLIPFGHETPFIVASMGASAVLMFSSPASPMASSWSFIVGNLVSATIGVTVFILFGNTPLSAGLAVAIAVIAMHFTHSIHPPGGATALYAVTGGPLIENLGYLYLLTPVVLNLLVFFLLVQLNRYYLRNKQRHLQYATKMQNVMLAHTDKMGKKTDSVFIDTDIEQAIKLIGGNPDISLKYLTQVIESTLTHAQVRRIEEMGYETLQINPPILRFGDKLLIAWQKLQHEEQEVIVILDPGDKFVGIITLVDFLTLVKGNDLNVTESINQSVKLTAEIKQALLPSGFLEHNKPEVCGQLARNIPQLTDLNNAKSVLVQKSTPYVALVDGYGKFICLLVGNK